ncbi:MAG TPA: methionyl-tRNA formyltransferase [Leptolyngbyaceae cyanobacterium M33_DOE_097]|uniref:Methionyl-tRNA formyltransferase n=1 Tax=Oscillatoriales cyanobacterium SpSt-418 TaxID=2282169 RepID=A0A7C3KGR2_9CYAN|nr:methionyl-tRNA formyltransferase [Leptolyngbyaceae cyanobacterium M33_DOE_097]
MQIVFFGTPQFAVPSLEKLLSHPDFDVRAVVTQPDKRRGRGNQLIPAPVKVVAETHQIPVWQPVRIKKDEVTLTKLRDLAADAFIVVAYGQILSPEILAMPRLGCINAHGSLLPYYRGAAPIQWSICHGEAETGITTMLMDAGMDTGPMLIEAKTPIALLENAHDLATRLAHLSADLLVDTLHGLENNTIQPRPQNSDLATYAPLIKKEDYVLDWSKPAIALHNQVRGFYPSCVTTFRGESLKVIATAPLGETYKAALPEELQALEVPSLEESKQPGAIASLIKGIGPIVKTGDGYLLLREVQLAGKRAQSGWDFANGSRLSETDVLGVA